jgi:hypothetical protein
VLAETMGGAIYDRCSSSIIAAADGVLDVASANGGWIPDQFAPRGEPLWGRGHEPPSWGPSATAQGAYSLAVAHVYSGARVYLDASRSMLDLVTSRRVLSANGREWWYHFQQPFTLAPYWGDGNGVAVFGEDLAHWPGGREGGERGGLSSQPQGYVAAVRRFLGWLDSGGAS